MPIFYFVVFFVSLAVLLWSANKMVSATSSISNYYKISPLITGAVIIGFGTSSPELAVSALAAWENQIAIAVGNAFGSNITNLLLVLGIAGLTATVHSDKKILIYMFPLVLIATILPGLLMFDLSLSRIDGIILVAALVIILRIIITKMGDQLEMPDTVVEKNIGQSIIWLLVSLILLLAASESVVRSAIAIAELFNINKLVIGLTIVAIGTSLPEIVTAAVATYRKHHALVIGNILGSNIFNSLAVLGLAALIGPAPVPAIALLRDFPVMLIATLLVWGLLARPAKLNRSGSFICLLCFIIYTTYLYKYAVE